MQQVRVTRARRAVNEAAVVSADLFGFRAGSFQGGLSRSQARAAALKGRPAIKAVPAFLLDDLGVSEPDYSAEYA